MVKPGYVTAILIALLFFLGAIAPAQAEIEVSIDRNPVQVNESFQLVFTLDSSPDREPDFSVLQRNFLILGNNRSSSISIINGEYQRSIKWTLQLMAREAGEYRIPPIRFGRERSKPFEITVKPSSPASAPDDELVIEMSADKTEVYVQSQLILTLKLLSATNISAYQFGEVTLQDLDAVIEPLGDARQYQTRIADKPYLVLEKQFALFPQQNGRLVVEPVMAEVRLPSRKSFDPFQTGGEIRRLRSQALAIDVKPIPPGFDAPYWLPATRVELQENWQGDLGGLVAGEPVTRSLTLIADGLTAAQLPELPLSSIPGIKQYPDQPGLDNSRSSDGVRGRREQKVALIPGAEGIYQVPEISLPWWNLQSGKVEFATLPARELVVNAATGATLPLPITAPDTAKTETAASGNRFWVWLSLLLACGWGLSVLYWWLARRRLQRAPMTAVEPASLRDARASLQRACGDGDAQAARLALLDWGRALLEPREIANLHALGAALGADIALQIERLNHSLYAPQGETWQGDELLSLCRRLERETKPRKPSGGGLSPLNPVA